MKNNPELKYSNTVVIIPAYNEARAIGDIVSSIKDSYRGLHVVVINDGSKDNTKEIAKKAGATVLTHTYTMGYGVAIQTGYMYAFRHGYQFLVQIDGDGQHDVRDIETLLSTLKKSDCDIVLGSRFLGSSEYKSTTLRRFGISFFTTLIRWITKKNITDPTTGFQAMNRKVIEIFIKDSFPYDYPDADIIIMLSKLKTSIKEVSVRMYPNAEGKSMHNNPLKVLYYMFKMTMSIFLTQCRRACV